MRSTVQPYENWIVPFLQVVISAFQNGLPQPAHCPVSPRITDGIGLDWIGLVLKRVAMKMIGSDRIASLASDYGALLTEMNYCLKSRHNTLFLTVYVLLFSSFPQPCLPFPTVPSPFLPTDYHRMQSSPFEIQRSPAELTNPSTGPLGLLLQYRAVYTQQRIPCRRLL